MEARKYVTEEAEPMALCEPAVAYGVARKRTDRSQLMTVDEFYDYCMKRIDEVYG